MTLVGNPRVGFGVGSVQSTLCQIEQLAVSATMPIMMIAEGVAEYARNLTHATTMDVIPLFMLIRECYVDVAAVGELNWFAQGLGWIQERHKNSRIGMVELPLDSVPPIVAVNYYTLTWIDEVASAVNGANENTAVAMMPGSAAWESDVKGGIQPMYERLRLIEPGRALEIISPEGLPSANSTTAVLQLLSAYLKADTETVLDILAVRSEEAAKNHSDFLMLKDLLTRVLMQTYFTRLMVRSKGKERLK